MFVNYIIYCEGTVCVTSNIEYNYVKGMNTLIHSEAYFPPQHINDIVLN